MTIFDYVAFGLFALAFVIGLASGFVKQLLGLLGLGVVIFGTYFLYEIPKAWFAEMASGIALDLIAIGVTVIVICIVWGILSSIISKSVKKVDILKKADVILGGLLGVAAVYCFLAIAIGVLKVDIEIVKLVKDFLQLDTVLSNSWFVSTVFTPNPLGDLVAGLLG